MTINEILNSLQYGDEITAGGRKIANVSIAEAGSFRSDENNIKLFVRFADGRDMVILSGDLKRS